MNIEQREKIVCYILAVVLCLWGMSVAGPTANSSFSRVLNEVGAASATLSSVEHIVEADVVCIPNFMNKNSGVVRNNVSNSTIRWQDRGVLLFFVVGVFQQYLFYYQSAECKEDGRIFSCRTAIVDYIHLKDSGE